MSVLRFTTPSRDKLAEGCEQRILMAGLEGVPWRLRAAWRDGELIVERSTAESGYLSVPWPVAEHGELMLSTATVIPRQRPYLLDVEIARGTVNRLRNQLCQWELAGLEVEEAFQEQIYEVSRLFSQAATRQNEPAEAAQLAQQAIDKGIARIDLLCSEFTRQVLEIRHRQMPQLGTLFGVAIPPAPLPSTVAGGVTSAFNAVQVALPWSSIETNEGERNFQAVEKQLQWCKGTKLRTVAGPVLRTDAASLPDWIYLWEDEFDDIQTCVLQQAEAVVNQLKGKVHVWHAAAAMNRPQALELSEADCLRLTFRTVETIRRHDPRTPIFVSFDQPWGEYMGKQDYDRSPLHFADDLARADIGLSAVGIEINLGYIPAGTETRDLLEFSRLIDRWSLLELPLLVFLTSPGDSGPDPRAANKFEGQGSPRQQAALADQLIPLLAAKQSVQAVFWNQLRDSQPHLYPHGGLFDAKDQPRPLIKSLAAFRKQHLS